MEQQSSVTDPKSAVFWIVLWFIGLTLLGVVPMAETMEPNQIDRIVVEQPSDSQKG